MKTLMTSCLLACGFALAGCATPPADTVLAAATVKQNAEERKADEEMLTGSRIPQRSSTHTLRTTSNQGYKESVRESGQYNPDMHR